MDLNSITDTVLRCAINVHRHLGPGLLETAYETCLALDFTKNNLRFQQQLPLSMDYDGVKIHCVYRVDFLVEESVIVEVKAIKTIDPIHIAQTLTYMRLADCRLGLIINFNVTSLSDGIRRLVNNYDGPLPRLPRSPR